MIKIKIKSLLNEAVGRTFDLNATRPVSALQQAQKLDKTKIIESIFRKYGFLVLERLGGGQYSEVFSLEPIDTSRYEGMGRQKFIGKVAISDKEYLPYEKVKEIKEQVKNDPSHPEYANYLPTVYVAEKIDDNGYNSVIISEHLERLDPNVKQLMYGGYEVSTMFQGAVDYPVRLNIIISKLKQLEDVEGVFQKAFEAGIQELANSFYISAASEKQVRAIPFKHFYEFLEKTKSYEYLSNIEELSNNIINIPYDQLRGSLTNPNQPQSATTDAERMNVGSNALKAIIIQYCSKFLKFLELQNIADLQQHEIMRAVKKFYDKINYIASEEPTPMKYSDVPLTSKFMSEQEPSKSFIEGLDYISTNYNFKFRDLHEENVMMREDKTLVVADLGLFKY